MAIRKISIKEFLERYPHMPVLDVRSPGEYNHAHVPGAYSLPLFTDEERKVVGTLYKQQGRQMAIRRGLDFFGPKMRPMVEEVEKMLRKQKQESSPVIIHCWRGGMRSAGVAWLMDLYGFEVYTLVGGYKAFRKWALQKFEEDQDYLILGGYTGSGKTDIIQSLKHRGEQVIDLEFLAAHKGSAFGALGQPPQPTQEMFENRIALQLQELESGPCWLEDESQRIGKLNIPHAMWNIMRKKQVFFVDIPVSARLEYILEHYGAFEKEKLSEAILRIQQKLGGLETKNALAFLSEGNIRECFSILLKYYDKLYKKSLANRENLSTLLNEIESQNTDANEIAGRLIMLRQKINHQ